MEVAQGVNTFGDGSETRGPNAHRIWPVTTTYGIGPPCAAASPTLGQRISGSILPAVCAEALARAQRTELAASSERVRRMRGGSAKKTARAKLTARLATGLTHASAKATR